MYSLLCLVCMDAGLHCRRCPRPDPRHPRGSRHTQGLLWTWWSEERVLWLPPSRGRVGQHRGLRGAAVRCGLGWDVGLRWGAGGFAGRREGEHRPGHPLVLMFTLHSQSHAPAPGSCSRGAEFPKATLRLRGALVQPEPSAPSGSS